jgi:hypothetical protein
MESPTKSETSSDPPGPIDFGGSIDLDVPSRPGPAGPPPVPIALGIRPVAPAPPPPQSNRGGPPPVGAPPAAEAYPGATAPPVVSLDLSAPEPSPVNQQLQEAARKAAVIGREVAAQTRVAAAKTRDVAMAAAIATIGGSQPKKLIRLEDPSTWLKPMLGPIIAFGVAVLLTFIGVLAGVPGMRWISLVILLGAVGFGVVRWMRLQSDERD